MTKFFLLGLFGLLSAVMTAQAQVFDNLPITEAEKQWFDTGFVQSCCNLGDAFISDLYFEKDGHFYAEITDGFDHHPKVQRVIIPPGTIREIPPEIFNKMKTAPQNPTNHGIIFLYLSFDGLQGYHMTPQTGVLAVKPEEADVLFTGGGPEAKCMRRPPLSRFVPSQKRGADPLPMAHSATSSATGAIKLSCTTVRRTVALPPRKTS